MKHVIFALALGLSTSVAQAQSTADLAKQYIEMPQVQEMISEMFSPQNMTAQMMASMPPGITFTEEQQAQLGQVLSDEMNAMRPKLEGLMEATTAELFTVEEISALITFYSSEHGASVMKKMTPMMQNVMGAMAPDLQAMQQRLTPKIIEILSSEN